jgi:hypothetical protein
VRDHHDLPASLGRLKQGNQFVIDRLRVQVLLGLVDDKRPVIVIVERKV